MGSANSKTSSKGSTPTWTEHNDRSYAVYYTEKSKYYSEKANYFRVKSKPDASSQKPATAKSTTEKKQKQPKKIRWNFEFGDEREFNREHRKAWQAMSRDLQRKIYMTVKPEEMGNIVKCWMRLHEGDEKGREALREFLVGELGIGEGREGEEDLPKYSK